MSRRPFIAGNWKLNLGPEDARQVATELRTLLAGHTDVTVAIFPTALSIPAVLPVLAGSEIGVGVQEIEETPSGALTGGNSAEVARAIGCTYALVGHSERRQHWGETDEGCAAKVAEAFRAGLLPILCVGETLEERRAGQVDAIVTGQLERGLAHLEPDQVAAVTIAYEPVWAIGTGETASPAQAQAVHKTLRDWLRSHYGAIAEDIRIQYGGSVKPSNAAELMAQPDIDGALVGGASLTAESFAGIVAAVR
jgi:triosephosphate isomerase (TIM)